MSRRITYIFCALLVLAFLLLVSRYSLNYYVLDSNKIWVSYEVKLKNDDSLSVYIDDGTGFNPDKYVFSEVKGKSHFQKINFPVIRTKKLSVLRFDFGQHNNAFAVKNVQVHSATDKTTLLREIKSINTNHIKQFRIHNKTFSGEIDGDDPYLIDNTSLKNLQLMGAPAHDSIFLGCLYLLFFGISVFVVIKAPGFHYFQNQTNNPQIIFAVLFLGYLFIHVISLTTGIFENDFSLEKRKPEAFPNSKDTSKVVQLEKWLTDQFALRQHLTRGKSLINYNLYHNSSLPSKVLIGKNYEMFSGMFFLNDDYQGKMQIDEIQWKSIRKNLLERIWYCKENGMHYYLFFNPNKQTIYPNEMPLPLRKLNTPTKTLLAQIRRRIEADSTLKNYVIFSTDTLATQVKKNPSFKLFHKNDLHWNGWGAYYAYQKLMLRIKEDFSAIQPYQKSFFNIRAEVDMEGDLARQLLLHAHCKRRMYYFVPKNKSYRYQLFATTGRNSKPLFKSYNPHRSLPKILVFRDSYFQDLIQFTSLHFSEATYIWDQEFDIEAIEEANPDIVLQEIAELFVYDLFRVNPKSIQREI